jgi:integrase
LEVLQLFGATKNKRDYVLLSLLYDTGLRVSEALNLRVSDIDSGRMVIHVRKGKGGKDRFVKLSTTLLRELRSYWKMYQPEEILFPSPKRRGQPLKITYVQRMCKKAAKQAGIKKRVYPHLLRHQAATRMIDLDTNMPTVQAVLGHSDINCTTRYIHLTKKNISGARSPLEALGILGS